MEPSAKQTTVIWKGLDELLVRIERHIFSRYRVRTGVNGLPHVRRVIHFGHLLARRHCPDSCATVLLGCALHDIGRVPADDAADERRQNVGHGRRSAEIARQLVAQHFPELQQEVLFAAIAIHDLGQVSRDPVTGCIWDADRLDLFRVKPKVTTDRFSTTSASHMLTYARRVVSSHPEGMARPLGLPAVGAPALGEYTAHAV